MQDCWIDPYTNRPSFTDIVKNLESVVESDGVSHSSLIYFLSFTFVL